LTVVCWVGEWVEGSSNHPPTQHTLNVQTFADGFIREIFLFSGHF